jgi:hypothetical protein
MSDITTHNGEIDTTFKTEGRIVIVGASLAGLRAAEALRNEGFAGQLTLSGDEPYRPYDRPPYLSKSWPGDFLWDIHLWHRCAISTPTGCLVLQLPG